MVGETAKKKRGAPFLALLLMMLMNFLHNTPCGATTSIFEPSTTSPYLARMDEPDWMFDSEISRMLVDRAHVTPPTNNPNEAAIRCGRFKNGSDYKRCLQAIRNHTPVIENCDPFNRIGC
jgi:hypothetical protein